MNYIKITKHDIANGQGVRVVLWCSGCTCCCSECHNPESWDFDTGIVFDQSAKEEIYAALNHSYIQGITLSGGHPFEVKNCDQDFYDFIKELKDKFPTKDIWAYTGWTWETIQNKNPMAWKLIQDFVDVIVDGPYIEELKDISLKFRGSKNQRLIDVKQTFKSGEITLLK